MTQIILNGTHMPQISGDKYACYEELLGEYITMISCRMVLEIRGKVWKARAYYDWLPNDVYTAALVTLRSGRPFPAAVLPDNSSEMIASTFMVESLTPATFAFDDNGEAVWRGLGFLLREVRPHA